MIKLHQEKDWHESMEGTHHHYHFHIVKDLTKICYRIFLYLKPRSWYGKLVEMDEDENDLGTGIVLSAIRDFDSTAKISEVKRAALEEIKQYLQ